MIIELQYLILFLSFLLLEGLVINGVRECFAEGNIFYKLLSSFIENNKGKWWTMPLWSCVKCMASTYGSIMFWLAAYPLFGVNYFTIIGWVINCFALVSLNYFLYKKL